MTCQDFGVNVNRHIRHETARESSEINLEHTMQLKGWVASTAMTMEMRQDLEMD